jgi:GntR family transcriptional regulator, transcriptional repressor for pyruvate dehydrogenase complex
VALDQALTLESLKLVLPEDGRPDEARRRLLEGFFALKREVTVELLAACCEHASAEDLDELGGACFALREEAHWREDRRAWVRQEFTLLRLAARAADRPGHALLIQSLEKAFRGLADRILPHLDAGATEQWALFAFGALHERDAQALRRELPALLQAVDARLVDPLAPSSASPTPPTPSPAPQPIPPPEQEALSGATGPNRYACRTSSEPARPTEGLPPQEVPTSSALTPSANSFGGTAAPARAPSGGAEPLGEADSAQRQAAHLLEVGTPPPNSEHPARLRRSGEETGAGVRALSPERG